MVTIPHPKKDLRIKTVASIFKQAGINKEDIRYWGQTKNKLYKTIR